LPVRTREHSTPIDLAWAGTFLPTEAGIQDGLRATTAWWLSPAFSIRDAAVQLEPVPDLDGP
jgi:transcriptional regulator GlxA family with amidase domain